MLIMLAAALVLVQDVTPPAQPASASPEPVAPPTLQNPDTSKLPRRRDAALGFVSGRVAIAGEGRLPDEALVQVSCPGGASRSVRTLDRFDVPIMPDPTWEAGQTVACQLTVSLSGYLPHQSSVFPGGSVQAGLILLRARPGVKGFTYSATSLLAPPAAREAFERGLRWAQKKKHKEAIAAWEQAVQLHSKYSAAWLQLGIAQQSQQRNAVARDAFERAWAADAKFLPPLLHLAALASSERDWKRAANLSDQLIALNRFEFPEAYLYNAVAFYNLGHAQPAEQAVRSALELDQTHQHPKCHQLLGVILAERGEMATAVEQFRLFLKYAPKSPDATVVKARLAEIEKTLRSGGFQRAPIP